MYPIHFKFFFLWGLLFVFTVGSVNGQSETERTMPMAEADWLLLDASDATDLTDSLVLSTLDSQNEDFFITPRQDSIQWQPYTPNNTIVDFSKVFPAGNRGYAYTSIYQEEKKQMLFRFGSSGPARVWINGRLALEQKTERRHKYLENAFWAELAPGRNTVVIFVRGINKDWVFSLLNPEKEERIVHGRVTLHSGEPAIGAEVQVICAGRVISQVSTTDLGEYAVEIPQALSDCQLKVTAYEEGMGHWEVIPANHKSGSSPILIQLRSSPSISGTVYHLDGETPQADVHIEAIRESDNLIGATTSSTALGLFMLSNLPDGTYRLRIPLSGGNTIHRDGGSGVSDFAPVVIENGRSVSNIELKFPGFRKGKWTHLTTLDGLPYNIINDVIIDAEGKLICATFNGGICSYDGHRFEQFTTYDGLIKNTAQVLLEASDGSLWIGTDNGVSKYEEGGFQTIQFTDDEHEHDVRKIFEDSRGRIWVASVQGLYQLQGGQFQPAEAFNTLAPRRYTTGLVEDENGGIWISTLGGVIYYDNRTFAVKDRFIGEAVEDIIIAQDGSLWLATHKGVVRLLNDEVERWTTKQGLVNDSVNEICESENGLLWFATDGGISSYDGHSFINYSANQGLPFNGVHSLECSGYKSLWAGTENGLSRLDYSINFFARGEGLLKPDKMLAGIFDISNSTNGDLYISSHWRGVFRFDGLQFIQVNGVGGELYSRSMLELPSGRHIVGTHKGMVTFDANSTLHNPVIWGNDNWTIALEQDDSGALWAGHGWGRDGLIKYDLESGQQLERYTLEDGIPDDRVWSLKYSAIHGLWIGTSTGIALFRDGEFHDIHAELGLRPASIFSIYEDEEGYTWFAGANGVYRFSGTSWTHFTREGIYGLLEGSRELINPSLKLPENIVWSIHQGLDGVMWFGTQSRGLVGYDGVAYSTIDSRAGLLGNHVMAISSGQGGEMWTGTLDGGLTQLDRSKRPHKVAIEAISSGKDTYAMYDSLPIFVSDKPITLTYNEVDLYSHAGSQQFLITIKDQKGRNHHQVLTQDRMYSWLPDKAGAYTAQVQYIDPFLNYSAASSVSLRVRLPVFKNPIIIFPAILVLIGVIGYTLGLSLQYRRQKIHARVIEQKMLAAETAAKEALEFKNQELESTNIELSCLNHELVEINQKLENRTDHLREALEANKEILGITAHDLKNPLSGIIGLAEMIIEDLGRGMKSTYESAADNVPLLRDEAERMLKIITELLDKHRNGGEVSLNKENTILGDVVASVIRWNKKQADDKKISLNYTANLTIVAFIDLMAIQRALDNYVSNAIKYSPRDTSVWIELQTVEEDTELNEGKRVKISVRDEGPGLTEADKKNVFGKMQRLSAKPTAGEHSTGLGLFIVKQLVEAHGGEVGVESEVNQGATFWLTLPLGQTDVLTQPLTPSVTSEV